MTRQLGGSIIDHDGQVWLTEAFIAPRESGRLFATLLNSLAWQEERVHICGREVRVPRLVCWYGDPGARYRYSGVTHEPLPWTADLRMLKGRIAEYCGRPFNSVLGNLYRDGCDSVGWHADRERELGEQPLIASLSLGATRLFRLRHNKSRARYDIPLRDGDLLLMAGALQRCWRHCVPRTSNSVAARINLTFRNIVDTV